MIEQMTRPLFHRLPVTYFVSTVGGDGSGGWSLRSLFSSFLAFFSRSLFRFSN
jgi:hypothetical protein